MRKWLIALCCTFSLLVHASEPLTLDWLDLVPESERSMINEQGIAAFIDHNGGKAKQNQMGKVREELNGSQVKLPGFVIPLEGDDKAVTEFLLVPYFGACIHVPPPPPNQIIYVKFPSGAPIQQLWDVVYIIGELKTQHVSHDLAEVGYLIEGTRLEEYDDM